MVKKINVGMVGYKFIGKAHSHAYRDVAMFFETETVPVMKVICGRTETAVSEAAGRFGWETYETSWEKLVQRQDIGLVDINTPNSTHREIAIAAAKAGKHILCEKPLAVSLAKAEEMLEAARIDGASNFQMFVKIILPISKSAIATCIILLFLETWNEFLFALIFLQNPKLQTVPVAIAKIAGGKYLASLGIYGAAITITIIPILIVFVIFQRWFIAGVTLGAVKG